MAGQLIRLLNCIELQTALIRESASPLGPGVDYAAFSSSCLDRSLIMSDVLSPPENEQVIATLNKILELELAGLVRYLHYSFMIFGHNRIPIVGWLRDQAEESKTHATQAGEHITNLGGHPSLKLGSLLETHKHNVDEILAEALAHEEEGLEEYRKLLKQVANKSIMLEEYCREQISAEEQHLAEIRKMMRKPGSIK
jgi:bacterioferritin